MHPWEYVFFSSVDDILERQNKIKYPSTSDACDIRTCTDHRRGRGHWLHISNGKINIGIPMRSYRRLLQIQNKSDFTNSGARQIIEGLIEATDILLKKRLGK